jgi:protein SCO1/2
MIKVLLLKKPTGMPLKKNIKFIIGIAVAAVLPLSFGLIVRNISKDNISIPKYFRVEKINSSMTDGKMVHDTVFHRVKDLRLTNQLGQEVSLNSALKGKMLVVNFMAPRQGGIADSLSANMRIIQKAFLKKSTELVQFISISTDTPPDSISMLRQYADRFHADHDHWWFLTGDSALIHDYAQNELGLSLQASNPQDSLPDYSTDFVLIDTNRYIRGYFDGMKLKDLRTISDDVVILSMIKKK